MFEFLTLGTTLAFLDMAVKTQIEEQADERFPREMEGTGGRIMLHKNHNPGFSFGVLKEFPKVVEVLPLCITSFLSGIWLYIMGTKGRYVKKTALTLALAGGVSNLYDRYYRGYVVDYFSIQWKGIKKVVMNLADVFVTVGMLLFVLSELFEAVREYNGEK